MTNLTRTETTRANLIRPAKMELASEESSGARGGVQPVTALGRAVAARARPGFARGGEAFAVRGLVGLSAGGPSRTPLRATPTGEAHAGPVKTFRYDFASGTDGFSGGFSDYPAGEEGFYQLRFEHAALPPEVGPGHGLEVVGDNHSDDLFMFVKRRVQGLLPDTRYEVAFELEFASDAPDGAVGIGGSPANSVWLKAGVTKEEPRALLGEDGKMALTVDHGNQSRGGADAVVLGDVAKPSEDFGAFERIRRDNVLKPFRFKTDSSGSAWLLVGTDSGFEGRTRLYYTSIRATFRKAA